MSMKKTKLNAPNCITTLRIAGTFCLLFIRPLSPVFFVIYTCTGLTDVLDGWLARRMGCAGEFGARLDSVADLCFYAVMLIRIFPVLWDRLPTEIWYAVAGIVLLRLSAYFVAAIKYRKFASVHTYLNKLTGAAVFAVPYGIALPFAVPVCWVVCGIAAAASLEELLLHICSSVYRTDRRSIIAERKSENGV